MARWTLDRMPDQAGRAAVVTGRLLDALQAAPAARIVTVSSMAHRYAAIDFDNLNAKRGYDRMPAYGRSKLANLLFTFELARRLGTAGSPVIATAAHPGWTGTDLQRHSRFMSFFNRFFAQSPRMGALPTLRAATDPEAETGDYFGPRGFSELRGCPVKVGSSAAARSEPDAGRLWEVSERLTGVSFLPRASGAC